MIEILIITRVKNVTAHNAANTSIRCEKVRFPANTSFCKLATLVKIMIFLF